MSISGLPSERDLAFLIGQTLVGLELGSRFRFERIGGGAHSWGTIDCECEWFLRDPRGELTDRGLTPANSSEPAVSGSERARAITELIGRRVCGVLVEDPDDRERDQAIELLFDGGFALRFVANRGPCESLGIQPGNIYF